MSAVPHSCLFVVDREEASGVLIRPIYGPGQGVPNPRDLMPDDLSGADVMKIKTKCTVNVTCLNRPETTMTPPHPWKNCLPRNWFLVLKRLGTGDPGGLCTWTLTGPVEAVALWAMCRGAKESPLRAFQGVVRPHLSALHSCMYHFYMRFLNRLHQVR